MMRHSAAREIQDGIQWSDIVWVEWPRRCIVPFVPVTLNVHAYRSHEEIHENDDSLMNKWRVVNKLNRRTDRRRSADTRCRGRCRLAAIVRLYALLVVLSGRRKIIYVGLGSESRHIILTSKRRRTVCLPVIYYCYSALASGTSENLQRSRRELFKLDIT